LAAKPAPIALLREFRALRFDGYFGTMLTRANPSRGFSKKGEYPTMKRSIRVALLLGGLVVTLRAAAVQAAQQSTAAHSVRIGSAAVTA